MSNEHSNINKNNLLLMVIIILAMVLRFFYLDKVPNGFYSDEAAYGYNAYSILKTGKDEYGEFLPLAFKSFGEYKAPLYIYFTVPFVGIFGLSELGVRSASAFLGVAVVFLIYLLVKIIFHRNKIALLTSFVVTISPLSLQFNRMAHEVNLSSFLILSGILLFILSFRWKNLILLSLSVFALSLYNHNDVRVITPLLLVTLFILYRDDLFKIKVRLFTAVFLFAVILIPLLSIVKSEAFWNRPKFVSIISDKGIYLQINSERGEDKKLNFFNQIIFHNKAIGISRQFFGNYLSHFNPNFLFFTGDGNEIFSTVNIGILYLIDLPFLLVGSYFLIKNKQRFKVIVVCLLLIAPIPSALTKFVPSASRSYLMLLPLAIIIATGIQAISEAFEGKRLNKIGFILIAVLFSMNMSYYLHYYYFNTQLRYAKAWHYGVKEVMDKVSQLQDYYSQIWFSKNAWGYIYPLFYLKYPPEKYQPQAKLSSLNEFGFGWVSGFDKYVFDDIPDKSKLTNGILYIGDPKDFTDAKKPLYKVYYPNGQTAFYLVDKISF